MADPKIKIEATPQDLMEYHSLLGNAPPDAYNQVFGNVDTRVPTVDPNLRVNLSRRPDVASQAAASIAGLNSPMSLTPWQRMNFSVAPQSPPPPSGPPLRPHLLGAIPPAPAPLTTTGPTADHQSFLSKVGGVLGKIGHVAGKVGEVAGDVLLPELVQNIPGTALNKEMLAHQQRAGDEFTSEQALRKAQTDLAEAEAKKAGLTKVGDTPEARLIEYDKLHPGADPNDHARLYYALTGKLPEEKNPAEPKIITTEGGKIATLGSDNVLKPIMNAGTPAIQPESSIPGGQLPIPGMPPTQAVAQQKEKEEKENKAVSGTIGGKPAWGVQTETGWIDPQTRQPIPEFKPAPTFAQTGLFSPVEVNVGGQIVPGSFNARTGAVTQAPISGGNQPVAIPKGTGTEINKNLETARGADTRYRVMVDSEKPALNGNQQAMLNILSNHIGMTMGLQKGARITQAVWDEAQATAPWLQKVAAKFDSQGYLSGVTLSPQQIHQMIELGQNRRVREWQQAYEAAQQNGIDIGNTVPQDVRQTLGSAAGGGAREGSPVGAGLPSFSQWKNSRK